MRKQYIFLTLVVLTIANISTDALGMKRRRPFRDSSHPAKRRKISNVVIPEPRLAQDTGVIELPELHIAALSGDLDKVEELLTKNHVNPNELDIHGHKAIYYAAKAGHTDICDLLSKKSNLGRGRGSKFAGRLLSESIDLLSALCGEDLETKLKAGEFTRGRIIFSDLMKTQEKVSAGESISKELGKIVAYRILTDVEFEYAQSNTHLLLSDYPEYLVGTRHEQDMFANPVRQNSDKVTTQYAEDVDDWVDFDDEITVSE